MDLSPFKSIEAINFKNTNFSKPFDPWKATEIIDEDVQEKMQVNPPKLYTRPFQYYPKYVGRLTEEQTKVERSKQEHKAAQAHGFVFPPDGKQPTNLFLEMGVNQKVRSS